MAEAKIITWLLWTLGLPVYVYTIWINITTWKADILFAVALIGFMVRMYYFIRQKDQALREKEIEIRRKQKEP